jgi:hypothetical protein
MVVRCSVLFFEFTTVIRRYSLCMYSNWYVLYVLVTGSCQSQERITRTSCCTYTVNTSWWWACAQTCRGWMTKKLRINNASRWFSLQRYSNNAFTKQRTLMKLSMCILSLKSFCTFKFMKVKNKYQFFVAAVFNKIGLYNLKSRVLFVVFIFAKSAWHVLQYHAVLLV